MKRALTFGLGALACLALATAAAAAEKTVTGTLEDSFCFVTMGAHGPDHKKCATECAKKGIPVALVQKDTGDMYVLLPTKNDRSLPEDVISRMEGEVTITGDEYSKGGVHYLTVKSVK